MAQNYFDPGSGAVNTSAAPAASAATVQLGQGGVQGGGVPAIQLAQAVQPDQSDRTLDALIGFGSGLIERSMKQAQNKEFVKGVQKVMSGAAVKDIVDEQPWYTQIFGPTSTVQGARAAAQVGQVDKYTTSLYNAMPELQQMSPDEVGKVVTDKMQEFMTGDDITDSAVQMKMVDSVGPFFKAHGKAHYKWQQGNMQATVSQNYLQAAGVLEGAAAQVAAGTSTPDDYNAVESSVAGSIMPMAGQSPDSYWSGIEAATVTAMQNGNFHLNKLLKRSGVLASAPAEVQTKIIDAQQRYEREAMDKQALVKYSGELAAIQAGARAGGWSPNQVANAINGLNAKVQAELGVEGDMVNRKEFTSLLAGSLSDLYREARADRRESMRIQATQQLEVAKEQAKYDSAFQLLTTGNAGLAPSLGISPAIVDGVASKAWETKEAGGGNPYVGPDGIVANYNQRGYVNKDLQSKAVAGIRASELAGYSGDSFNLSNQIFNNMVSSSDGGYGAASAYFGQDNAMKMLQYNTLVAGRVPPEQAYAAAFGQQVQQSEITRPWEVWKSVAQTVEKDQPGFWNRAFTGKNALNTQSQNLLATEVGKVRDTLVKNLHIDVDRANRMALQVTKPSFDILGPYAFKVREGQLPLYQMLGTDEEKAGELFADEIAKMARTQGVTGDITGEKTSAATRMHPRIAGGQLDQRALERFGEDQSVTITPNRQFGEGGEAYQTYSVIIVRKDGTTTTGIVDSRDIRAKYEASRASGLKK
ncbi:internal virion protein [Pseudomonas phage vB_PpuP-Kurepalu-1]